MSDKGFVTVVCEVALSNMFGYSTDLRSSTQVCSPPHTLCFKCGRPVWMVQRQ